MPEIDPLQQLQLDATARLGAHPSFADVIVHHARPRDAGDAVMIENKIHNALRGLELKNDKGGLVLTVMMPELELPTPGMPGPNLLEVVMTVRVVENPMFNMGANGTLITAEDAAVKTLQALHHWSPNGANAFMGDKKPVRPVPNQSLPTYDVICRMPMGLSIYPFVQKPVISESAPIVTLSCATDGASIHYTLDGSLPTPDSAEYTAPLDLGGQAAGTLLRVAAYKSGLLGSSVSQLAL